jgi:hypothetical protein
MAKLMALLKLELSGVKALIKLQIEYRVDLRVNARNLSAFFARISEPER